MADIPVITVDGPSGTGKGTVCSCLANSLAWNLLDSGAIYRTVAIAAAKHQLPVDDELAIASMARALDIVFQNTEQQDSITVLLEGRDISQDIRTDACSHVASQIAALPKVRDALLQRQREFRQVPGLVADGRDMGTVVFTDATLKIYLIASPEVRAERRYKQLKQKGFNVNLRELLTSIAKRDAKDSQRVISPLKPADDAIVIDTTALQVSAVTRKIERLVRDRMPDIFA